MPRRVELFKSLTAAHVVGGLVAGTILGPAFFPSSNLGMSALAGLGLVIALHYMLDNREVSMPRIMRDEINGC